MLTILLALATNQAVDLRDEGTSLGWARTLDCSGPGVTCSLDSTTRVGTVACGAGGGLPDGGDISGEAFVTSSSTSVLSNELALGTLGTGLLINTTATGVPTILGAQTCTNQFARSETASGTWTCAGLGVADFTANQGTTTTVLHGNAAGQPAFGNIATGDLGSNIIAIANGGTNGSATPTNGGVAYGTGSAVAYSAVGTSGQVLTSAAAGAPVWKNSGTLIRVSGSDFTTTSATAVDITGLSITTAAGTPYMFQCVLDVTGTATGGARATVTVTTSTVTSMAYEMTTLTTATTTQLYQVGSASETLSTTCTSSCLTTDHPLRITGMVNINANAGTITIGAANGTAGQTTTVKIGSYCIWWTP
jgi:hypothetical protein